MLRELFSSTEKRLLFRCIQVLFASTQYRHLLLCFRFQRISKRVTAPAIIGSSAPRASNRQLSAAIPREQNRTRSFTRTTCHPCSIPAFLVIHNYRPLQRKAPDNSRAFGSEVCSRFKPPANFRYVTRCLPAGRQILSLLRVPPSAMLKLPGREVR